MNNTPLHSVSVAGVAFDDAGRVLLIKRRDTGEWQAPGGVLELDESFESGVVREVFEETGVRVKVEALTGVYKNMARGVVALVYRCQHVGGRPAPSQEASDVRWVHVDEVERTMRPAFAVRVLDALPEQANSAASRVHDGREML